MKVYLIELDSAESVRLSRELMDHGHRVLGADVSRNASLTSSLDGTLKGPPDAFLISLGDRAADALDAIERVLTSRALRARPILFIGSDGDSLEQARARFPGANFARPDQLFTSLASLSA